MKLPRWLMISMLSASALVVLGAVACWWITWPVRTARDFVALIAEGKWWSSGQSVTLEPGLAVPDYIVGNWQRDLQRNGPQWQALTPADVVTGRRRFTTTQRTGFVYFEFTAQGGKVSSKSALVEPVSSP